MKRIDKKTSKAFLWIVPVIIAAGFIVYGNSLKGQFIWDDEGLISENAYVKDWSKAGRFFTQDIAAGAGGKTSSYRPLQMLSYAWDHTFWRLNVVGYHLTNILLHIAAALALWLLVYMICGDLRLSSAAALLFVVHPVHTEAVSYISGRADPLAALFMLLCFIFYVRSYDIAAILLYGAALLSREGSIILPVLLLLYHFAFKQKVRWGRVAPFIVISVIYLLLRLTVLKTFRSELSYSTTLAQRLPGSFAAVATYVKLLFLPFPLHMEYAVRWFSWSDPLVAVGVMMALGSLIWAVFSRNRNRLITFSIGWFFLSLVPVANIYPINVYLAEHWLYLPSIGFFVLAAQGLCFLYEKKTLRAAAAIIFIGVFGYYSVLTVRQNGYWRDPVTFYERTLAYAPFSGRLFRNLADAYQKSGRYEDSIAAYKRAIELLPDDQKDASTYNRLGVSYALTGQGQEALASFKKALELEPDSVEGVTNSGNAYASLGLFKEAISAYHRALELDPGYDMARKNLDNLYRQNPDLR